jgi:iron complex outermembrane receptor protein
MASAQRDTIAIYFKDRVTQLPIEGVLILTKSDKLNREFQSDKEGLAKIPVAQFPATLMIYGPGYGDTSISVSKLTSLPEIIYLQLSGLSLNEVVVSVTRQEQKLENTTQSIEIIKPEFIERTQSSQIQEAIQKLPGVQVQKDQMTIRGISGFSYGAGSRVLILLDDMPMLSAGTGDAKWNYYPVENIDQIEVLKGAASALYGSSALEGIISLHTAIASDTSFTSFRIFSGFYSKPKRKSTAYWTGHSPPAQYGLSFAHRQTFGPVKVTASVYGYEDEGFRFGDHNKWIRGNLFALYHPANNDKIIVGGALNGLTSRGSNFLFFGDVAEPYLPYQGTLSEFTNNRWNADVFIKYYPNNQNKYILRTRLFNTHNINNTNQGSNNYLSFNEYQAQKTLFSEVGINSVIIYGANYVYSKILGGALYGDHINHNVAGYLELNSFYGRLNFSFGARMELNKLDKFAWARSPVFRSGISRRMNKGGYLRMFAGQGFRYPSAAEIFTSTSSGAINIFPNADLKPESGWNTEIGFKQLYKKNNLRGYFDISVFWAEYKDMIEYQFGFYPPRIYNPLDALKYVGFKAKNTPETHIKGAEFTFMANYKLHKANLIVSGGYTYVLPLDLRYTNKDTLERLHFLKYRRPHMFRMNAEFNIGKFESGIFYQYNSQMLNIDDFFLDAIKGMRTNDYWQTHSSGSLFDLQLAYKINKILKVGLNIKNIFNKEYLEIPGNTNAPRTYLLQISGQF